MKVCILELDNDDIFFIDHERRYRNSTGYGPIREHLSGYGRLLFDRDERKYERSEVKFSWTHAIANLKDAMSAETEKGLSAT